MAHKTIKLVKEIPIDEDIAPLILKLWGLGFNTEYSCQGNKSAKSKADYAQVLFPSNLYGYWFCAILDYIHVKYHSEFRSEAFGSGISVEFLHEDINFITRWLHEPTNFQIIQAFRYSLNNSLDTIDGQYFKTIRNTLNGTN